MNTYKKAAERRKEILAAACELAEKDHYSKIRRHHLVACCGTAAGNISRIMGDMNQLRNAIITHALEKRRYVIVAQAIIDKHPLIEHLDGAQRRQVLQAAA